MVTITLGEPFVYTLAGAVAGALVVLFGLVLLIAFGHWHIHLGWLSQAKMAGARRVFKLVFVPVLGALLTNAATWSVALLIHFHVDPTLANAAGVFVVGPALGGIHQTLTWNTDTPSTVVPPVAPADPAPTDTPAP